MSIEKEPQSLRDAFMMLNLDSIIPNDLKQRFQQEENEIISGAMSRLERIRKYDPKQKINLMELMKDSISEWVALTLKKDAFLRYQKLMDESGIRPHNLKFFTVFKPSGRADTYTRFMCIESKGIKIGCEVEYLGQKFKVKTITKDCYVTLENKEGTLNPLSFEVIK